MKTLIISLKIFLFFTILTGIIYPLFITGIAQIIFPTQANGSLIMKNNKIIGSELIGQQFDSPIYFSSRPSTIAYNSLPSGGSNLSITNAKLQILVGERKDKFIEFNHLEKSTNIPAEMLFASASGLDPHISLQAALLQVDRISEARHFNANQKQKLVECINKSIENPQFLCLGEERINVLLLNLNLDKL